MRSKNDVPLQVQFNVTFAQIYINQKILLTVLPVFGYNLLMSAKFLINSKILHSWYIKREYWLVSVLISNYVKFRFDDVICHFTLFADDMAPQQDSKSQRMSHIGKVC